MKTGIKKIMRRLTPARIIALGFALVILFGSLLLSLPFSIRDGVSLSYADALYTATSAVCVTGLVVVDIADTFTLFGQMVVLLLMQVGGLGVAAVGTGIILAIGRKVDLKGRTLIREAMNLGSDKGTVGFLRYVLLTTLIFEIAGAVLTYPVFAGDYPPLRALFISIFHSVAAFNNSGFDVLGGMRSLTPYSENIMLNIVTMLLITAGGIGFFVIRELWEKRFRWRRLSMHTRVVITVSAVLTFGGALLLCLTEDIPFLGALFSSVSARTAGFSSYPLGGFSNAGLIVMETLMFVGASPGSTGGGVKTTTLFALVQGVKASATNRGEKAFHYSLPKDAFRKAVIIVAIGAFVVLTGTYLLSVFDPGVSFRDSFFEIVSAFGTVGLSTGITSGLSLPSKILSILIMYTGRLGPMTIATLWYFSGGERVSYPTGNISIG